MVGTDQGDIYATVLCPGMICTVAHVVLVAVYKLGFPGSELLKQ